MRVVDDDEEREAGEPGRVRLPLEPVQRLGQPSRCDAELLDAVEAASVHLPCLAGHTALRLLRVLRRLEVIVERDEVERRADPGHRRNHVQPAKQQVAPAPPVVRERDEVRHRPVLQRSSAICTSSSTAVSSSASRGRCRRASSTGTISRRGRPLTNTTNRNPKRSSYAALSSASLARTAGSSSVPCSRARARRGGLAADRRVRVEQLLLLGRRELRGNLARVGERVLERCEQLHEARPPFEQLRELLDRQLPR